MTERLAGIDTPAEKIAESIQRTASAGELSRSERQEVEISTVAFRRLIQVQELKAKKVAKAGRGSRPH